MKKHFKALSSRALAGLVLAFDFGAATLAGGAQLVVRPGITSTVTLVVIEEQGGKG